jgi:serine/threonine-protein kinase
MAASPQKGAESVVALLHQRFGSYGGGEGFESYGGCRPLDTIATGRLSTVYRGAHTGTGEIVAIKVLSEYGCRVASKLSRLKKDWEGERALKLQHPNVVRTIACGDVHGRHYIVMELLAGGNLSSLLQAKLSAIEGRRIELMRQAARGLEYVHSRGVIHRDISPRNIMFSGDGAAKLIDFGVAINRTDHVLKRGMRTGRPGFMAPELIRDYCYNQATDIYAYGVSLYCVATGQRPFRTSDDPFEALAVALNTPVPPPSSVRPTISKRLEAIILRAMDPHPQKRYLSVTRLLDDLAGVTDADL